MKCCNRLLTLWLKCHVQDVSQTPITWETLLEAFRDSAGTACRQTNRLANQSWNLVVAITCTSSWVCHKASTTVVYLLHTLWYLWLTMPRMLFHLCYYCIMLSLPQHKFVLTVIAITVSFLTPSHYYSYYTCYTECCGVDAHVHRREEEESKGGGCVMWTALSSPQSSLANSWLWQPLTMSVFWTIHLMSVYLDGLP